MRRKEEWVPPYLTLECLRNLTEEQKQQVYEKVKLRYPFWGAADNNQVILWHIEIAKELGFDVPTQ